MQLDPAEKRSIWWKGALKGAAWNFVTGLAIGFVAAAAIYLLLPPISSALGIAPVMGSVMSFVAPGESFSAWPLMGFNAFISAAVGLFTGGSQAVAEYHQQKHNLRDEAKLQEMDGRTLALEHEVARSRHVQKIVAAGPRHAANFEVAEVARTAEPQAHTIH